ncbi:hypothetical protein CEXT_766631 [Caerostris extrusa]|uniref:Uncharacterized protein n=1 Tax=Caerostris extrusa TaxID=172846 RepID=A0AAV4N8H7_CAEEX|nr:hypothetical protein CEXT_766631 [Caerostris extrusa]
MDVFREEKVERDPFPFTFGGGGVDDKGTLDKKHHFVDCLVCRLVDADVFPEVKLKYINRKLLLLYYIDVNVYHNGALSERRPISGSVLKRQFEKYSTWKEELRIPTTLSSFCV